MAYSKKELNVLSEAFLHLPLWPIFRQSHPNFITVRLRNLGTTDKKSSHKIRHRKIPREHLIFLEETMELNIKGASKGQILKKLFLSTLYLSAFTFGGGYVIVTLMKTKFVDQYHWIDEEEMLDLVAIAQSCPGAIAVNGAIVVGYKLAGLTGVLCSVVATVIPPFVILSAISFCYAAFRSNLIVGWMLNGMQSGVGAVIMEVSFSMASGIVKEKQYLSIFIMAAAFIANYFYKVSAIVLILICIALGVVLTLYREKKAKKNDRNTSQDNAQKGGAL